MPSPAFTHKHFIFLYLIPLLSAWYLIVGDVLFCCSRPLASVSLSILTETGQSSTPAVIQTQSQVFWLPTPCSSSSSSSSSTSTSSSSAFTFPEPAAKRSKRHNDLNTCRLAVTAVTGLTPLLNSGCVKCSVTLHYIQKQDAFAPVSSSVMSVLHCGKIILDIRDDLQTRLLKNPELTTGKKQNNNSFSWFKTWIMKCGSSVFSPFFFFAQMKLQRTCWVWWRCWTTGSST